MIEPHTQKIIFVDESFMEDLKQRSIKAYRAFESPDFDTKVISLPLTASDPTELMRHVNASDVRPGNVLAKLGYTDQFVTLDNFSDDHAQNKFGVWLQLCVALGAKKVNVTNIEKVSLEANDDTSISGGIHGKSPVGSLTAAVKSDDSRQSEQDRHAIMKMKVEAEGGEPDFQAASNVLKQYGVDRDPMFRSLYNMRSVSSNRLVKHEFSLSMETDVKKVLNASLKAKIEVMSEMYEGNAEFERARTSMEKERTALKLTVTVEF